MNKLTLCSDNYFYRLGWLTDTLTVTATKTVQGWPKLWANFRALIGIFGQSVGPSLAMWVNRVSPFKNGQANLFLESIIQIPVFEFESDSGPNQVVSLTIDHPTLRRWIFFNFMTAGRFLGIQTTRSPH